MTHALLVFDLDGTLVDSRRDLADATNALIIERGGQPLPLDSVTEMVGEGAAVLVRRALAAAGLEGGSADALDRFLMLYDARLTAHTQPYPGIPGALEALRRRGVRLALLTNKPQHHTSRLMDALGLAPLFEEIVGGDTPAGRKPDPAGLLQIVARQGATVTSTMLVGDSPVDLSTARRAGTAICLARYGFGFRFSADAFRGDEIFVDSAAELVERLTAD